MWGMGSLPDVSLPERHLDPYDLKVFRGLTVLALTLTIPLFTDVGTVNEENIYDEYDKSGIFESDTCR